MNCAECFYWKSDGSYSGGQCRRYSPNSTLDGMPVWPVTKETDWCGDFKERFGKLEKK